jgi:hypothetical protein
LPNVRQFRPVRASYPIRPGQMWGVSRDSRQRASIRARTRDTGKIFDLQGSYQRTCGYLASLDLVHLDLRDPVPGDDGDDDDLSEEDAYRWSPALT